MDDLGRRLEDEVRRRQLLKQPDLAAVLARARRVRLYRNVGVAASAVALLAVSGLAFSAVTRSSDSRPIVVSTGTHVDPQPTRWVPASDGPIRTDGFIFRDLEMRIAPQVDPTATLRRLVLRGRIDFADGFPGKKMCTWDVLDAEGRVIGSATSSFLAAGPVSGLIKDRIDFDGEPTSVDIQCGGPRLDDPDGRMVISDISLEAGYSSSTGAEGAGLLVRFRYAWEGEGDPVPLLCDVEVFDSEGRFLARTTKRLVAAGKGPNNTWFHLKELDMDQGPDSATIDCVNAHTR